MNFLLLFLVAILIGSIIVIAISSNKKKKEEEPPAEICSKYIYNNTCVDSCGDKYVDEKTRTCYDAIPQGKFAFDKKIVSSCDDKYTDGQLCVLDCGEKYVDESKKICYDDIPSGKYADGKKIVSACGNKYVDNNICVETCNDRPVNIVTDGKDCVSVCDKILLFNANAQNVFECSTNCDYYYIHDIFKVMGPHNKYCITPNLVPFVDMTKLFINQDGSKFVFDLAHNAEDSSQLYLQKGVESKSLNPYLFETQDQLKYIRISPDGNTYAFVYSTYIDVYNQDVFRSQSLTPIRINTPLAESTIEECVVYDAMNVLMSIKRLDISIDENSYPSEIIYRFYHLIIQDSENIKYFTILNQSSTTNLDQEYVLKSSMKITSVDDQAFSSNTYNVGYVYKATTQDPTFLTYTVYTNKSTNTTQITNNQSQSIFSSPNVVYDTKISKDMGVIFFNNQSGIEMVFRVLQNNDYINDTDNSIMSFPAVSDNNQAYYAKLNNGIITVYRRYYDSVNTTFTFDTICSFGGQYSLNTYANIVCNIDGTKLLISIIDLAEDNSIISKELYKVDTSDLSTLPLSSNKIETILSSL